ncbi:MAG: hypothetical protein JNK04_08350 [Myxococcales bacterium]|nr:hypothetical protein [Myxococcales bacterium]
MNENDLEPLPDDLRDFLDAAREPEPVSQATKDRLFAGLVPFIPGGGGPTGGGPTGDGGGAPPVDGAVGGATATATSAASGLLQGKLVVAAVSAIIGAMGGAAVHATFAPPKTIVVAAPASSAVARAVEVAQVPSVSAAPTAEPSASVAVEAPSASSAPAEPTAVRKSSMRAERVLLEAANAALMRGDYATALASLQQHKQSYPRGELAPERDILMAQATKLKAAEKK